MKTGKKLTILAFVTLMAAMTSLSGGLAGAAGPVCTVPGDYATIQGAVNDPACTTINVAAGGTYNESVTINRAVILTGVPGGGTTPGPGLSAPILDGTGFNAKPAISIAQGVSNVVIEGFEIRNYGPNGNTNADGVVAWNSGTSNVTIQHNYMHNLGYAAVLTGNGWGGPQGLHDNWQITYNLN